MVTRSRVATHCNGQNSITFQGRRIINLDQSNPKTLRERKNPLLQVLSLYIMNLLPFFSHIPVHDNKQNADTHWRVFELRYANSYRKCMCCYGEGYPQLITLHNIQLIFQTMTIKPLMILLLAIGGATTCIYFCQMSEMLFHNISNMTH